MGVLSLEAEVIEGGGKVTLKIFHVGIVKSLTISTTPAGRIKDNQITPMIEKFMKCLKNNIALEKIKEENRW